MVKRLLLSNSISGVVHYIIFDMLIAHYIIFNVLIAHYIIFDVLIMIILGHAHRMCCSYLRWDSGHGGSLVSLHPVALQTVKVERE